MDDTANSMALLEREVLGRAGVRMAAGRFDSTLFAVGRRKIGHVHRDGIADLPVPRRVREEVLALGRVVPHHAGVAGYVSVPIRDAEGVANAIALFRLTYERAVAAGAPTQPTPPVDRSPAPRGRANSPPAPASGMPTIANTNAAVIAGFRANRGQVQAPYPDPPPMLLHTIGARGGREYVVPLRGQPVGDAWCVFGSAHGSARHPDWYHNLRARPAIDIEVGADTIPVRAAVLHGVERDDAFARHAARFPIFADDRRRLARAVPVIRLDRRPPED